MVLLGANPACPSKNLAIEVILKNDQLSHDFNAQSSSSNVDVLLLPYISLLLRVPCV